MRHNQKGFSLVELIVTVAILAVVGGAVLGFIIAGMKSFQKVSEDVDLQYEAQLTFNQLKDIIIDTTKAVYYDSANDTLSIYNDGYSYDVYFIENGTDANGNAVTNRLYLRKNTLKNDGSVDVTGEESLMAEYVTDFSVELPSNKSSVVIVKMTFSDGKRSYSSSQNYSLRNLVYYLTDPSKLAEIYGNSPTYASITGVELYYNGTNAASLTVPYTDNMFLSGATTVQFSSKVVGSINPVPSQDVTWKVENGTDSTIDHTGKVIIGENETATTLTITCTSDANNIYSNTFTLNLMKVSGITVSLSSETMPDNGKFEALRPVKLLVNYTGVGDLGHLSSGDKRVVWKDESGNVLGESSDGEFTYTIPASEEGKNKTITAYYKGNTTDANLRSSYAFQVESPQYALRIVPVNYSGNDSSYKLKRGDTGLKFKAELYNKATGQATSDKMGNVYWTVSGLDSKYSDCISLTKNKGSDTVIKCDTKLSYNTSTSLVLNAELRDRNLKVSQTIEIDSVSIQFTNASYKEPNSTLTIYLIQPVADVKYIVKYDLKGIEDTQIGLRDYYNANSYGNNRNSEKYSAYINASNSVIEFKSTGWGKTGWEDCVVYINENNEWKDLGCKIQVLNYIPSDNTLNDALTKSFNYQNYGYNAYYNILNTTTEAYDTKVGFEFYYDGTYQRTYNYHKNQGDGSWTYY